MRERLVVGFALLTVGVLVAFTLTRAYSVSALVTSEETRKVERSAVLVAQLLSAREAAHQPVTSSYLSSLVNQAEEVEYRPPAGPPVRAAGAGWGPARDPQDIVRTEPVPGGGSVTMRRDGRLVEQRINASLLPLVLLGVLLVAVASLLGWLGARVLARPFRELAVSAEALGRGRFDLSVPRYSIPEADTIGRALERSAAQLRDLLRREREFAGNVSHQLRTPVTALRLELEDLSTWEETTPAMRAQLQRSLRELDRLNDTVTHLLDLARGSRLGSAERTDLAQLAREAVRRWQPLAGDRHLELEADRPVTVHLAAGPVEQILDVLVENAIRHGTGTITLEVVDGGDHARLCVRDEGTARLDDAVFERHVNHPESTGLGIGLSVARDVAEAIGARLIIDEAPSTSFSLLLPTR
jgi:signal transduction histidine kinase